jgi:hypothetical protein
MRGEERRKGRSWDKGRLGYERGGGGGKELLDYEKKRGEKGGGVKTKKEVKVMGRRVEERRK